MLVSLTDFIPQYLLDTTLVYVVVLNQKGEYVYLNDLFRKYLKSHHFSVIAHFIDYIHEKDVAKWEKTFAACLCGKPTNNKLELCNKNYLSDKSIPIIWEINTVKPTNLQESYVLLIGKEPQQEISSQTSAQALAYQLENVVENMTDGFFMLSNQWEILSVNKITERLFNKTKAELIGQKFWEVVQTNNKNKTKEHIYPAMYLQAMNTQKQVVFEEYMHSIEQCFLVSVYPFQGGIVVFYRNITPQKIILKRLQNSERKLKAILNSTTDSHILISPNYNILSFNKVAADNVRVLMQKELKIGGSMLNYTLKESKEEFIKDFQKCLTGEIVSLEKALVFDNGAIMWFDVKYVPIYEDGHLIGVSFNTTNIDIRKKAELKVLEQNSDLMSIAWLQSHEVRKPVANILGLVELLKDENNPAYVEFLQKEAEELDKIIREIVSLTNSVNKE
ncbi:MAG: PAS domain S-box protein [Thermoflexibacteraceae bacterium]